MTLHPDLQTSAQLAVHTGGVQLPQTPLLALIRRESNVLGFVVTAVINSGKHCSTSGHGSIGSNSGCSINS